MTERRAPTGRRSRAAVLVVGLAFRAAPLHAALLLAVTIGAALTGAANALATRAVVDAIVRQDVEAVTVAVAVLAALGIFGSASSLLSFILRERVVDETRLLLDLRLMALSTDLPAIEHHERGIYVDEMSRIRERRGQLAGSVASLVTLAMNVTMLLGMSAALATVHPVLLLLPLAGVPSFLLNARGERIMRTVWEERTEQYRRVSHLFRLSSTAEPGKEIRLFGLGSVLRRRHDDDWHDITVASNAAGWHKTSLDAVGLMVFAAGYLGALTFSASRIIDGHGTPGDLAVVLRLGSSVNEVVGQLVGTMSWAIQSLDVVRRYLFLQDYGAAAVAPVVDSVLVPDRLTDGIRLERVTFAYPGTTVDVLRDVDLHVPAGSTLAIVGDNGAGKSTLVKLLCRFYEPTAGSITVDGVDLRRFGVEEWREASAAGFQDFARFELLAREAVGVGDLPKLDHDPAVLHALRRASASDVVSRLPAGLDTQLGKTFTEGTELSGGQWQKLALGRAMMRAAPLLLLLDEPTAAIDAETEHALFERFTGAARTAAQRNGAITVLVSHRFSTVRMADLIVVVDRGGVVEVGSHDELLARGGLYAELYELQASGYR